MYFLMYTIGDDSSPIPVVAENPIRLSLAPIPVLAELVTITGESYELSNLARMPSHPTSTSDALDI